MRPLIRPICPRGPLSLALLASAVLLAGPASFAQEAPESVRAVEARGAARVLLEEAAFEETHERDVERAIELFKRAAAAAELAKAPQVAKEAKEGVARCEAKRGRGTMVVGADLPLSAYSALQSEEVRLYGDRLLPVLLRGIEVGYVFDGQGKRHALSAKAAISQLVELRTPRAREALRSLLKGRDPVLRQVVIDRLHPTHDASELTLALADPVARLRSAAAQRVHDVYGPYMRVTLPAPLVTALAKASQDGLPDAVRALSRHAPLALASLLNDPKTPAKHRPGIAAWLNRSIAPSDPNDLANGWVSPLLKGQVDSPIDRALLSAVERGEARLKEQWIFGMLQFRTPPLVPELAARYEAQLLRADAELLRNVASRKDLEAGLAKVAGRLTIEASLPTTPTPLIRLDEAVHAANQRFGATLADLRSHREWLEADLARLGPLRSWAKALPSLVSGLTGSAPDKEPAAATRLRFNNPAMDKEVVALLRLTIKRFGRERSETLVLSLPSLAGRPTKAGLAELRAVLEPLGTAVLLRHLPSVASLKRYLGSPAPSGTAPLSFEGVLPCPPSTLLELLDTAHPTRRDEAITFLSTYPQHQPASFADPALRAYVKDIEREGRQATSADLRAFLAQRGADFEEALVAKLTTDERLAHGARLLKRLESAAAWEDVAEASIANPGSATSAALGVIAEALPLRNRKLAARVALRVWPFLSSSSRWFGTLEFKVLWPRLCREFPAETRASLAQTVEAIRLRAKREGDLSSVGEDRLRDLLVTLLGVDPDAVRVFREARASLQALGLETDAALSLLARVGRDLPRETLDLLKAVRWEAGGRVLLLEAIARTHSFEFLEVIEAGLQDSDADVRDRAERAIRALMNARAQAQALARLKTGLNTPELRELAVLLDDPSSAVATGAARALGRLGEPAALPVLVRRLRTADANLKTAIEAAMDALTAAKTPPSASPPASKAP